MSMNTLAPRGWRQWTPEEARRALAQWKKSGLPAATFARVLGVSSNRLRWWKRQLGERSPAPTSSSPAKFVPAVITSVSAVPIAVVQVGGGSIEVFDAGAVSASWVAAVARELLGA